MKTCRTRVIGNVNGPEIVTGRGNISFTSINLPRLAIEANKDVDKFFSLLDEALYMVKEQLLQRFQWQCKKRKKNFPMALGEKELLGSEKVSEDEGLYEVYKHGSLSTGFIGLAEALVSLTGKHHGECEQSQELGLKIIKHMRDFCNKQSSDNSLNFSLLATPAEGLAKKFVMLDKEIYGEIPGVTDKAYYTNSSHVPVRHNISIADKIKIEAPYHELCNAGQIGYIELDGNAANNLQAFEAIILKMCESNMGYMAVNHPVDYCPCCFYTGVINDICPKCKRRDEEWPDSGTVRQLLEEGQNVSEEVLKKIKEEEETK